MGFLIGLLTFVMVLDCLVLVFLVLIQLPKKDAGAGLAFGGTATDALFGAGSGTVLTKITKYAAGTFFVLAVLLSLMQKSYHSRSGAAFANELGKTRTPASAVAPVPGPAQPQAVTPTTPSSNAPVVFPPAEATNLPVVPTNLPAPPATNK